MKSKYIIETWYKDADDYWQSRQKVDIRAIFRDQKTDSEESRLYGKYIPAT